MTNLAIVPNPQDPEMVTPSDNPIGDYILRVMDEQNWRPVDVLANAKRLKLKLRQATFAEIYSGQTKNPQIFTLMTISKALGRPFEELVAEIQGRTPVRATPFRQGDPLSEMYEQMGNKERRIADRLLEMLKREFAELLSGNVRQM